MRIAATVEPRPGVLVSAYRNPASKKFAVVLTNTNQGQTTVSLSGVSMADAELYRTSAP